MGSLIQRKTPFPLRGGGRGVFGGALWGVWGATTRQPPIIPPRTAMGFVAGRGGRGGGLPGAPPAVPCGPKCGLRGGAMGRRLRWPPLSTGFL